MLLFAIQILKEISNKKKNYYGSNADELLRTD
jgi:hypothetical protein